MEYLPDDHPGRQTYGEAKDPTPDKGRPLRDKAYIDKLFADLG